MDSTIHKRNAARLDITHTQRSQPNTTTRKKKCGIWNPANNNVGVIHESAISALLFAIHIGDRMEGNYALNYRERLPARLTRQRGQHTGTTHLLQRIQKNITRKLGNTINTLETSYKDSINKRK